MLYCKRPFVSFASESSVHFKMSATSVIEKAKSIAQPTEPQKLSGVNLYSRFAFAGAVCCAVTHGAFTPVDV